MSGGTTSWVLQSYISNLCHDPTWRVLAFPSSRLADVHTVCSSLGTFDAPHQPTHYYVPRGAGRCISNVTLQRYVYTQFTISHARAAAILKSVVFLQMGLFGGMEVDGSLEGTSRRSKRGWSRNRYRATGVTGWVGSAPT